MMPPATNPISATVATGDRKRPAHAAAGSALPTGELRCADLPHLRRPRRAATRDLPPSPAMAHWPVGPVYPTCYTGCATARSCRRTPPKPCRPRRPAPGRPTAPHGSGEGPNRASAAPQTADLPTAWAAGSSACVKVARSSKRSGLARRYSPARSAAATAARCSSALRLIFPRRHYFGCDAPAVGDGSPEGGQAGAGGDHHHGRVGVVGDAECRPARLDTR
jgi:hypothetical protein